MERSKKPDWKYWNAYDLLEVWQAVALSIDRDPSAIRDLRQRLTGGRRDGPIRLFDGGPEFHRRLDVLESAIDLHPSQFLPLNDPYRGFRPFDEWKVSPGKVRAFFASRGFDVPQEWSESKPDTANRWPWGDYKTELLDHLDATVRRYWRNYDPKEGNANTKPEVVDWLMEQGCTKNQAEAIDLILRPKDLPKGPRR